MYVQHCYAREIFRSYFIKVGFILLLLIVTSLNLISTRSGVLNLLVLAYPQIKIYFLCVPPNHNFTSFAYPQIKNSTQLCLFQVPFLFCKHKWNQLRTPCELYVYPQGYAYPRLRTAGLVNQLSYHFRLIFQIKEAFFLFSFIIRQQVSWCPHIKKKDFW